MPKAKEVKEVKEVKEQKGPLKVAIVMGAECDLPVVKKAIVKLDELKIPRDVRVLSAHRTPEEACRFAAEAREAGYGVIICAAGKAAHLAGIMAANTTLPVIGIPVKGALMDGLDALLSTVQMPAGVPVASVAINGAANAALLAAQILAVSDSKLAERLSLMRRLMAEEVLESDKRVSAQFAEPIAQ